MKKSLILSVGFVLGMAFVALVSACSSTVSGDSTPRFSNGYDDTLGITQDSQTKCKYVIYSDGSFHMGGITPLLKSDGKPDCGNN